MRTFVDDQWTCAVEKGEQNHDPYHRRVGKLLACVLPKERDISEMLYQIWSANPSNLDPAQVYGRCIVMTRRKLYNVHRQAQANSNVSACNSNF